MTPRWASVLLLGPLACTGSLGCTTPARPDAGGDRDVPGMDTTSIDPRADVPVAPTVDTPLDVPTDAPPDTPPPLCTRDDECDDGNPCNGREACGTAGDCVPGMLLSCPDDGNPCTLDVCSPSGGCGSSVSPGTACAPDDPATCERFTCSPDGICGASTTCPPGTFCCGGGICSSVPC